MRKLLFLMAAAIVALGFTACAEDNGDNPVPEPVEYGKVFSYTYKGQTLYYIINESGEASVEYPMYPGFDTENDETWTGYDKPVGSVVIPDYVPRGGNIYPVTEVDYCAFFRCYDITSVALPSKLRTIDKHAFLYCGSLESATVPEGVTSIGLGSFDKCVNMTSVKLPSTLTSLGDYAFYKCYSLESVDIPEGVTGIGHFAFGDCSSLESITLPNTLQNIGQLVFDRCTKLDNVVFPDHLPHLNTAVLQGCTSLTTCHLPAQMEYIDDWLFCHTAISHIDIPEHVTRIGMRAFLDCPSLKELTLPASVKELADSVFTLGTRLETLTVGSAVPPTVTPTTFEDYSTVIIVPKGTGDAYRSDEIWGRFATITEKE